MYLSHLTIEGFRIFGTKQDNAHCELAFNAGLNVLVGENDSGKSAIIDAIRFALQTTSQEYIRFLEDDFHLSLNGRCQEFSIRCQFSGLTLKEAGMFLEHISRDQNNDPYLQVSLTASLRDVIKQGVVIGRKVYSTTNSGVNGDGPVITGELREFIRSTYLRPLRDAEAELNASRGSRLSQILQSHSAFGQQNQSDFDPEDFDSHPKTLVGIARRAKHETDRNPVILHATRQLNEGYLSRFALGDDILQGSIGVAKSLELRQILESLQLRLEGTTSLPESTRRGLGVNNILFMSTELLLLNEPGGDDVNPLLLIEEPEAHLHPQLQSRLTEFLREKCNRRSTSGVQVLLTTHSPNLASDVPLECVTVVQNGKCFPLSKNHTKLNQADYRFLSRFLDVTKANLFFARGVIIVEGDAEQILLPILADLIGANLSKFGVTVINVGSVGLFRYSRIFQRTDGSQMRIRVSCLRDNDLPPLEAKDYLRPSEDRRYWSDFSNEEREQRVDAFKMDDCDTVRTFVSPNWTLEHDLALGECAECVCVAVKLAKALKNRQKLSAIELRGIILETRSEFRSWKEAGETSSVIAARIYEDLYKKRAGKPETAQILGEVLRRHKPAKQHLTEWLPKYIVQAILFATGKSVAEVAE